MNNIMLVNKLKQAEDLLTYNSDDDSDDEQVAGGEVVSEYKDDINEHEYQSYVSSRKIDALKGMTADIVKGSGRIKKTITWTIIPYHESPNPIQARSKAALGIRSQSILDDLNESNLPLADLFLYLTFRGGRWQRWLRVMNSRVKDLDKSKDLNRPIKEFTPQEFLIGHALMICASNCSDRGVMLWGDPNKENSKHDKAWQSLAQKTLLSPYMKLYQFKQFKKIIPLIWENDESTAPQDAWYKFQIAVENFNTIRKYDIITSERRVLDESMSAYRPHTTKLGGLPNISYILRKPKRLGTEFKTSVCPRLNVMTHLEICEGKDNMRSKPFQKELGGTTACAVRMSQGTCQIFIDQKVEVVSGDSWFSSVSSVLNIKKHCTHQKESVFSVKTTHSFFPKKLH
jgi:hypothetical protein